MAKQTLQAVDEADKVLFIVDGRQGVTAQDKIIAEQLRKTGQQLLLVVNKTEGMATAVVTAEFFELGLGDPCAVSAIHGDNINDLAELALIDFPSAEEPAQSKHPKIAIVGRPNVGKSTLINTLLGEERVIAFDQPGTTRDSIYIDYQREDAEGNSEDYTLIDTAGVRRRKNVAEAVEKFSILKTLQAIADSNVTLLLIDASEGLVDQDLHLMSHIVDAGRALVIVVNKWDGLAKDEK